MSKKIEVFVHKDGETKTITIEDQDTIDQLLREAAPQSHAHLDLFVDEQRHDRNHRLCDAGIGHHRHVHCHDKDRKEVEISIDGDPYRTHAGDNSVQHLRKLGHVPEINVLAEFRHGKFEDLDNSGHVKIHGHEVFVSHPPSTGSS